MTLRRAAIAIVPVVILLTAAGLAFGRGGIEAELRSVPAPRADARADRTVTDADVAELGRTLDASVSYVEGLFERAFVTRPKVVVFGTTATFNAGLAEIFDYSQGDVSLVASSYGGIFDRTISTIAVNLESVGPKGLGPTIDHELTHYLLKEITAGTQLPTWLDEGLATLAERHAGEDRWVEQDLLLGHAVAASGRVSLAQLETLAGWHATYPRFGQSLYAFAASAASEIRSRIGWTSLREAVAEVARGRSFADAYAAKANETLAALADRLQADQRSRIITRKLASGDAQWTMFTGRPLSGEKVTIAGNSTYSVSFTVTTDDLGIYRGSFGATAPPGAYLVSASGARASLDTGR